MTLLLVCGSPRCRKDIDHHDHAIRSMLGRWADEGLHADGVHLNSECRWALLSAVLNSELAVVAVIAFVAAEKAGKQASLLFFNVADGASATHPQFPPLGEFLSRWSRSSIVDGNNARVDLVVRHVRLGERG